MEAEKKSTELPEELECRKKEIKKLVIFVGVTIMYLYYLLLLDTFLSAYGTEDKRVLIDINAYGEANIEYIIFTLITPLAMLAYYFLIEELTCKKCSIKKVRKS